MLNCVVDHLIKRYPNLFKHTTIGVLNEITGEEIDLRRPLSEHPLAIVQRLAKEDFYIARERPDGRVYMVGGSVAFPGGFTISQKIGKTIDDIHAPVALYASKLQPSMEKWMKRLKPECPVERASFFITWNHGLFDTALGYRSDKAPDVSGVAYEDFVSGPDNSHRIYSLLRLFASSVKLYESFPRAMSSYSQTIQSSTRSRTWRMSLVSLQSS